MADNTNFTNFIENELNYKEFAKKLFNNQNNSKDLTKKFNFGSDYIFKDSTTKLGILPAWGGTTRLPRLIGADNAIDLICSGRSVRPKEALKLGLIDAIVTGGEDSLVSMVKNLTSEVSSRRSKKTGPVKLNMIESMMVFKFAASQVKKKAGPHYPAPIKALEIIEQCRKMKRDEALSYEQTAFAELIKTDVAKHFVNFVIDKYL